MDFLSARKEHPEEGFSPWEIALAKRVVNDFLFSHPMPHLEAKDLVQECLLQWWQQHQRYSPSRDASLKTYMRKVLQNKLRDIERHERADKRGGYSSEVSLDRSLDPEVEDSDSLGDMLPADAPEEEPESETERLELKANIDRVLGRLSEQQRWLAEKLGEGWPMTEISERLGVSRPTLYDELKRIREVFRDEGLEEFLK